MAIGVFVFGALFSAERPVPPALSRLVFDVAPPPPPPQLRGDPMAIEVSPEVPSPRVRETPVLTPSVMTVKAIPDDILSPAFELPRGAQEGFDEGSVDGLEGGIPGGVVGGVPGGLVGGTIGGTGRQVPRFPKPDVGPSPIRMPQPSYTREAIRDNVSGAVRLRVVIDEQGKVEVLEVLKSVPALDDEAIRVVESGWLFQPATKNGRPVPALSELVVRFRLY